MKMLCIGYEPTHAGVLERHAVQLRKEGHEVTVAAFDQELEWILAQAGVSFISSHDYRRGEQVQNLELAERLVADIRTRFLSILCYRGVALEAVFGFSLQVYIQKWLYFAEAMSEMLKREAPDTVYICTPYFSPSVEENTLLHYDNEAQVLCLRTLCAAKGIPCEVITAPVVLPPRAPGVLSHVLYAGLGILNGLMGFMQRKEDVRLLASEYWRHIAPVFDILPHSTLTLHDRREFRNISLKMIFRHRIRFMHGPQHLSHEAHARVAAAMEKLTSVWKSQKNVVLEPRAYREYDLSAVLANVVDDVITYQLRPVLNDIERMYALLYKVRPQAILLRVSMGAQTHFPILAQIAQEIGIPAIEIQHGLELFAPGSLSRRHMIEHIALYGELIRKEMQQMATGPKFSVVGYLDFDSLYAKLMPSEENKNGEMVCIAPDVFFSATYDTYDVYAYFHAVATAARASGMRVRVKLRNASRQQSFYREAVRRAFEGVHHTILQDESIAEVCRGAQLAVSCYSTATIELLICGVPTILAALAPAENHFVSFHFSQYAQDGALKIARTKDELSSIVTELSRHKSARHSLRQGVARFMASAYAFDGRAAERLAALIRALVKK
jgi:hypothetical protein